MELKIFDSKDEPYLEWMKENPDGFILKTQASADTKEFWLHKSNCSHIAVYGKDLLKGCFTSGNRMKIASNDISEIIDYCRSEKEHFTGQFTICKTCQPKYIDPSYSGELKGFKNLYFEGVKKEVLVNAYERNTKARNKCIEHYGLNCQCCGFNFEKKYGELGAGFIHVHHLTPISGIGKQYAIDPIKDLIPLCANCHEMVHKKEPPYTVQELKDKLKF